MNVSRRAGIRGCAVIAAAVAALAFSATAQATVDAGTKSKVPNPTKSGQGVPGKTDAYRAMKSAIGLQGMKNQEDLNAFKTWLITRPGIVDKGFYESAVDISSRRMTLQWHGTSPLQAQAVAEGKRRGLTVVVKSEPYTRASVERATRALLDPKNSARLHGFRVTSVAGPTVGNDRLTVAGMVAGNTRTSVADIGRLAPSLAPAAKSLTGLDATFKPGIPSVPYSTRSTDYSPFNAGGMIRGNNGSGCTSGFGIQRSGFTWTTTARHCDADSWTAWDNGANSYGNRYDADAGTGNRMLTGDGFYWMFDGAWNDANGFHKTVWALADVSQGSSICSSGANSGVHCNLIVENMNEAFNDGYGWFNTIRVHAQSGIAGAHGDSGGPMLIPSSDGAHVWAVGMLQGSNQAQTTNCGSLRISTSCSEWVEFSSERVFLNDIGATLYTG
jgi:hypothetical protein